MDQNGNNIATSSENSLIDGFEVKFLKNKTEFELMLHEKDSIIRNLESKVSSIETAQSFQVKSLELEIRTLNDRLRQSNTAININATGLWFAGGNEKNAEYTETISKLTKDIRDKESYNSSLRVQMTKRDNELRLLRAEIQDSKQEMEYQRSEQRRRELKYTQQLFELTNSCAQRAKEIKHIHEDQESLKIKLKESERLKQQLDLKMKSLERSTEETEYSLDNARKRIVELESANRILSDRIADVEARSTAISALHLRVYDAQMQVIPGAPLAPTTISLSRIRETGICCLSISRFDWNKVHDVRDIIEAEVSAQHPKSKNSMQMIHNTKYDKRTDSNFQTPSRNTSSYSPNESIENLGLPLQSTSASESFPLPVSMLATHLCPGTESQSVSFEKDRSSVPITFPMHFRLTNSADEEAPSLTIENKKYRKDLDNNNISHENRKKNESKGKKGKKKRGRQILTIDDDSVSQRAEGSDDEDNNSGAEDYIINGDDNINNSSSFKNSQQILQGNSSTSIKQLSLMKVPAVLYLKVKRATPLNSGAGISSTLTRGKDKLKNILNETGKQLLHLYNDSSVHVDKVDTVATTESTSNSDVLQNIKLSSATTGEMNKYVAAPLHNPSITSDKESARIYAFYFDDIKTANDLLASLDGFKKLEKALKGEESDENLEYYARKFLMPSVYEVLPSTCHGGLSASNQDSGDASRNGNFNFAAAVCDSALASFFGMDGNEAPSSSSQVKGVQDSVQKSTQRENEDGEVFESRKKVNSKRVGAWQEMLGGEEEGRLLRAHVESAKGQERLLDRRLQERNLHEKSNCSNLEDDGDMEDVWGGIVKWAGSSQTSSHQNQPSKSSFAKQSAANRESNERLRRDSTSSVASAQSAVSNSGASGILLGIFGGLKGGLQQLAGSQANRNGRAGILAGSSASSVLGFSRRGQRMAERYLSDNKKW